jgi:hypothetical protein
MYMHAGFFTAVAIDDGSAGTTYAAGVRSRTVTVVQTGRPCVGYIYIYILPPSQKECRFRISDILFDHPSYSNFFCKYHLFCYDLFYH